MAEKLHTQAAVKDIVTKIRRHQYLLCRMVPVMLMVVTSHFHYSALLVPWSDTELDKLHAVWSSANSSMRKHAYHAEIESVFEQFT